MVSFVGMDEASRAVRPLERVILFLGGLWILGVVLQICAFLFGQGSLPGLGAPAVCTTVSPWSSETFPVSNHNIRVVGLADGAHASVSTVNVCQSDPTRWEQILFTIHEWVPALFAAGLLFLLWRLLRHARLEGVFVRSFARRVTGLGVYVLLGGLAVSVLQSWSAWEIQKALIPGGSPQGAWTYSFIALLVGLGLVTVGRLMRYTVPMREELDATV
jgi:hypothetical protein